MKAKSLAEFREIKGLSQRRMASDLGISEPYLSEILSGKRTPSKRLALRISERTGIPVLALLYPSERNLNA